MLHTKLGKVWSSSSLEEDVNGHQTIAIGQILNILKKIPKISSFAIFFYKK